MAILCIVLGILMIMSGVACMFQPFLTLVHAGYFLGILLLVYGVFGIVRAITQKGGVLEWILNILAVILGVYALMNPASTLVLDGMVVYLLAAFFLVEGATHIALAFQNRGIQRGWYWSLIAGILGILLGVYTFAHPMFGAFTAGMLIGLFIIEIGISLMSFGMAVDKAD